MTSGSIYRYTSPSGKHYIGQTKNVCRRKWQHKRDSASKNNIFYRAIRKYGIDNFDFSVIVENVPSYLLNAFEMYWIGHYDSFKNGYNMSEGGYNAPSMIEETRIKIGNAHRGRKQSPEHIQKRAESRRGTKTTDETRKKLSEAHTGVKFSDSHIAAIAKANTGKKRTEKQKQKMSESAKKRGNNGVDTRKKVKNVLSGKVYLSAKEASLSIGKNKGYVSNKIINKSTEWRYI